MSGTEVLSGTGVRFRCILFDLDNTLYDFVAAKEKACIKVIESIGTGNPYDLMRSFLFSPHGVENPVVIREYLAECNIISEERISDAISIYTKSKLAAIVPYQGVYETIIKLDNAGMIIGAVTNATTEHAVERLTRIQLMEIMDCLVTPDNSGLRKPDSAMFIHTSLLLQVEPHQILVVGDNLLNDVKPAKQAGMFTAHAEYGNRLPPEFSEGIIPDYSLSSFPDILRIVGL